MRVQSDKEAVSTIMIILLIIISAMAGGVVSYMFTIPQYIEVPERTTLAVTGVYIDKENARSFKISVLNPSYSPTNATITRIALSLKGESQLYDIVETEPSIENGTVIQKGESLNIICSKVRRGDVDVTWGRFASEFAGETIIVHVFSPDSPAANIETTIPFVKLHITGANFDSKVSFRRFNITIMNDANSLINLTVNEIMVPGVEITEMSPALPQPIANGTPVDFTFNGSWHGLRKTTLEVFTEEEYTFSTDIELPGVYTIIQSVIFNEDYTDQFNVTMFNLAESANYVNVTKITCTLENGTIIPRDYDPPIGIMPNSTHTFTFNESWREYRGKEINVRAYFLQEFETEKNVTTPQPIIVKVLNKEEVFDLKDTEHFNITLQNHLSSLEAINITKIMVKETEDEINDTKASPQLPYGPIEPGQATTFYCNITNWAERAGGNLTLIIHTITNETLKEDTFEFAFTLPAAELNITSVTHIVIGETRYLNITVENLGHSVWNLTISKVIITLQNQSKPLEQTFPQNQIILKPSDEAVLLCVFDWEKYLGESITVTVITSEGVEASKPFQIPESTP